MHEELAPQNIGESNRLLVFDPTHCYWGSLVVSMPQAILSRLPSPTTQTGAVMIASPREVVVYISPKVP
jgi:hypothetical protein